MTNALRGLRRITAKAVARGRRVAANFKPDAANALADLIQTPSRPEIAGQAVIVTGSTRGVGEVVARGFAAVGARVFVNGRDGPAVDRVVMSIRAAGGIAHGIARDIATEDGARQLVHTALETFGGIDVLINNAGVFKAAGKTAWDTSTEQLADGPAWAKSPPSDHDRWSDVVAAVVRHFNGGLGLDAFYEVWNEPDNSWRGTLEEYLALYAATVRGARRADPAAKIGGPGISDWAAAGIGGPRDVSVRPLFLQKLLRYAATTPLPEAGLQRLPVDFVSWHAFYRDPSSYYAEVVPEVRRILEAEGYPVRTPLIVDEWNIAAVPPYPEGDLNAGIEGGIYVTASLIAMAEAGVDRQTFQMVVDPGAEGYSGGTFTATGLPRASFAAFMLAGRLAGDALIAGTSHRWLHVAAARERAVLRVLVAAFEPTPLMAVQAPFDTVPLTAPAAAVEMAGMADSTLRRVLLEGAPPPGRLGNKVTDLLKSGQDTYRRFESDRGRWLEDGRVTVRLPPDLAAGAAARVYTLNASTFPDLPTIRHDHGSLQGGIAARQGRALEALSNAGVSENTRAEFARSLQEDVAEAPMIKDPGAGVRAAIDEAYRTLLDPFLAERARLAESYLARVQQGEAISVAADGSLVLELEARDARLIVVEGRQ